MSKVTTLEAQKEIVAMTRKDLYWLVVALAVTPLVAQACGGDDSTTGTTAGAGATGGSSTGTSGSGGAGGTGGSGTAGTGGSVADSGSVPDGRTPCGTVPNGCTGNPTGTNVCDAPNNRCVECLSNTDCADEATQKTCDLRPMGAMMLPRGVCVVCVDSTHCPMGATCNAQNNCVTACGTSAMCTATPSGNNICDAPNNRCVDCLTDADCAVEPPNTHCDTRPNSAGLPANTCEECIDNTHCPAGMACDDGECATPCGTAFCQTGEICDAPNNRCVDCLSDTDCAGNAGNPRCDLRPNTAGLPTGNCEECIESSHCPMGQTCVSEECEPSCTTDANCSADGGGGSPYCHPTIRICTQCTNDMQCAGTNQPHCSASGDCDECVTDAHCTTAQPFCDEDECVQCRTSADCTAPQTCNNQGNCTGGTDAGGGTG